MRAALRLCSLVLALVAGVGSLPAHAETRAILVGVSRYQSASIPDLAGPANDVSAMERLARSLGASDIVTLADGAVTRSSVETAIHDMGQRSRSGDWVLFYFSG
ncbi:MAG: caspase family protein, partial [Blastomonas fulva]